MNWHLGLNKNNFLLCTNYVINTLVETFLEHARISVDWLMVPVDEQRTSLVCGSVASVTVINIYIYIHNIMILMI